MNSQQKPSNMIEFPKPSNWDMFESNQNKAYEKNLDSCPCCGKAIKSPSYFVNSIYGGYAYPANDKYEYQDSWPMAVGSECRKKFPEGYVFKWDVENEIL